MLSDPEVEAIRVVVETFDALEETARRRLYRWMVDRYAHLQGDGDSGPRHPAPADTEARSAAHSGVARKLGDLEALYAAAKATAQWERALITGYWLQVLQGRAQFDAQAVNQAMRECGYGISNITRELSKLHTGRLVVQLQTANSNGRRKFRLSRDGLRWCRGRLGQVET